MHEIQSKNDNKISKFRLKNPENFTMKFSPVERTSLNTRSSDKCWHSGATFCWCPFGASKWPRPSFTSRTIIRCENYNCIIVFTSFFQFSNLKNISTYVNAHAKMSYLVHRLYNPFAREQLGILVSDWMEHLRNNPNQQRLEQRLECAEH